MNTDFESPSQKELNDKAGTREPLVADDYIIKLAKISLVAGATWSKGGKIIQGVYQPVWKIIGLIYGLKGGGQMFDIRGNEVKPLTRWMFKDNVNPFATGFGGADKSTPSFVRTLVCYLNNIPLQERLRTKEFVMLKGTQEITDKDLKLRWLEQAKNPSGPQDLMEVYKCGHDLREFEGRYISCAILQTQKGNKIDSFSKLPANFVLPPADFESEAMKKFEDAYSKMMAKQNGVQSTSGGNMSQTHSEEINDEVSIEDVPF